MLGTGRALYGVIPIVAILYAIVVILARNSTVTVVGAMVVALVVIAVGMVARRPS